MNRSSQPVGLFNQHSALVAAHPFPHVIVDEYLRPEIFEDLERSFPTCLRSGPDTGARSLYWGDPEYDLHLNRHPVWRSLFEAVFSQSFLESVVSQFGSLWKKHGCKIDISKVRFVPYREDRIDKERTALRKVEFDPHEIWCRLDIHQAYPGYRKPIHLDHRRRLASILLYFNGPEENDMRGGQLLLHSPTADLELLCRMRVWQIPAFLTPALTWLSKPLAVTPRRNRMVMFLCTKKAWHSVPRVSSLRSPRNQIQITLSSSESVWS